MELHSYAVSGSHCPPLSGLRHIQQAQGLDLTPYQGKRATLYTYALTAYPTGEQGVTANLLVRRNRLIAADITSAQTDGFVHGLLDMPQT